MELRRSTREDIKDIMNIIKEAQEYFKEQGIDQWQNNYPNEKTIENDILKNESFVLIDGKDVVATTAISFREETTYRKIYNGKWLSDNDYVVLHRVAVSNKHKGLGLSSIIIKKVEEMCMEKGVTSIKIDTHKDNKSMKVLLEKSGFSYCGVIYLEDGNERIAFEKIISG